MNKNDIASMALEIIKWKYTNKKFPGEQTIINETGDTMILLQDKTKELGLENWFQDTINNTPPKTKQWKDKGGNTLIKITDGRTKTFDTKTPLEHDGYKWNEKWRNYYKYVQPGDASKEQQKYEKLGYTAEIINFDKT